MLPKLNNIWKEFFKQIDVYDKILFLFDEIYKNKNICPSRYKFFNLFNIIDPKKIKVIIIGQDPYHTPNVADGIAFSTQNSKTPPSLKNIFKELKSDLGIIKNHNDLSDWVKQGIFLINTIWTVKEGESLSHENMGWQEITQKILQKIYNINKNVIFCLWGNYAKKIYNNLSINSKFVLQAAHPSPFSFHRGFQNCGHFSKINDIIVRHKLGNIINW